MENGVQTVCAGGFDGLRREEVMDLCFEESLLATGHDTSDYGLSILGYDLPR